jgi:hypothetical protein
MQQFEFEEAIKAHLKRAGLSQAGVARKLHYTPEQFNKWVRGVNRIPDTAIQEFAHLLHLTDEERTELFTLADYVAVTALKKAPDTVDDLDGSDTRVAASGTILVALDSKFFINALKDWSNDFFRWSEASKYQMSSWTGRVIYALSAVTSHITPRGFLVFCVTLLLGIATAQLVTPVLQWPLDNIEARGIAYLKYGLATLIIPLFVASVSPPDIPNLFQLETTKQRMTFWSLKFTGALVSFWVFSILVIGVAMVWYYLHLPPIPTGISFVLALIPLFLSYVTARRIPLDRHKMYNGELRLHPADRLFLAVFIVAGPFMAIFLYSFYWFLSDRSVAPITLVAVSTIVALWEYRKRHSPSISDPVLILILGLFTPIPILLYAFFASPDLPPPALTEWPLMIVASIYILSWTLLLATILVRNKPTLTLRGVFSLLAIVVLATLITAANRWLGAGFLCLVILVWAFWGRNRFSQYFSVHGSFWVMIVATGICLYLLNSNLIPLWADGLSFLIISAILVGWAYRTLDNPPESKSEGNGA